MDGGTEGGVAQSRRRAVKDFVLSDEARSDLFEVWAFVAGDNPPAADKLSGTSCKPARSWRDGPTSGIAVTISAPMPACVFIRCAPGTSSSMKSAPSHCASCASCMARGMWRVSWRMTERWEILEPPLFLAL